MTIDFHTHGKLAKNLPFSPRYTAWLFREARAAGLDALCLTEHFNTLQFEDLYRYISSLGQRVGDALDFDGLRIFPGMEIDVAEGGHVLCIGPLESVLALHARLAPHREPGSFLPFSQLMDLCCDHPVLVGAGHPFREGGNLPQLPEQQLQRLDFFELNGKDAVGDPDVIELTYALGEKLGKPVAGGSDTHQAVQYGCVCTRFQEDCAAVGELYRQMLAGQYQVEVRPDAATRVKAARLVKRALKQIHALGGDYVALLLNEEALIS